MTNILFFIFAVFGAVEIIIKGKPTEPIRWIFHKFEWGREFIKCPLCLGFWIGVLFGRFFLPMSFLNFYLNLFLAGCAGAGSAYFLHSLVTVPTFEDFGGNDEMEEMAND